MLLNKDGQSCCGPYIGVVLEEMVSFLFTNSLTSASFATEWFKRVSYFSLIQNHFLGVLLSEVLGGGILSVLQNHLLAVLVTAERGGGGSEVCKTAVTIIMSASNCKTPPA